MIRTHSMQDTWIGGPEGLGVSTGDMSRVFSPQTLPVAFKACVLSLLLHLQRKYVGYFCSGDVTVWLHKHVHGFGEVRAAGT